MTKAETAKIMAVFQAAYPRYYAGQSEEEQRQAVNIWASMLSDRPYELVAAAVKAVIAISKFPPMVAEVIEKINAIQRGGEMTELEAWGYISKAVRNSTWHANEEWERLPEELRHIVSPDLLRSWAAIEADEVETVIHSNFLRTFRTAQARQREYDALPGSVKQYIAQIGGKTDGLLCMPGQGRCDMD